MYERNIEALKDTVARHGVIRNVKFHRKPVRIGGKTKIDADPVLHDRTAFELFADPLTAVDPQSQMPKPQVFRFIRPGRMLWIDEYFLLDPVAGKQHHRIIFPHFPESFPESEPRIKPDGPLRTGNDREMMDAGNHFAV